jgi:alkylation response protein AidB-like acyl-CoA dehydrogenase
VIPGAHLGMVRAMDLRFSPEEEAFRDEVRAYVKTAMPPHIKSKAETGAPFSNDEIMEWHRILHQKGWAAPHFPKSVGGSELDPTRRFILSEELSLAGAPGLSPFGLSMVGPLILRFGTDEQKQRFLPGIIDGTVAWCQGYSEPNAGSDLASLRTSAEDAGDHFVVNGQKTWTTYGQYADWIFCLVRTDASGKKQQGISFLLIEMNTPGVTVEPMLTLGGTPAFCETFFENVKVPKENLLGPLHGGWNLAKALLGHERTLIGSIAPVLRSIQHLKLVASHKREGARTLLDDSTLRDRIARLELRAKAHQMANYKALADQAAGKHPGPESSILKIVASTLQQEVDELTMEVMGPESLTWFNPEGAVPPLEAFVGPRFCYDRAVTIYGGSNEIQKNIIAKAILNLPG